MKNLLLYIGIIILTLSGCNNSSGLSANSTKEDLLGKPAAIFIGGTYCPHCQVSVPIIKEKIYNKYKDEINVWINVTDGQDGKHFNVSRIPQGYNEMFSFENLTGSVCPYIPAWVLLDDEGSVEMYSCGNNKTINELAQKIEELIN